MVSAEHADTFLARYTREAEKSQHKLFAVKLGSLDQLRNLVHLVSTKEVCYLTTSLLFYLIVEICRLLGTGKNRPFLENLETKPILFLL